mgnify:CR=1 FL=1
MQKEHTLKSYTRHLNLTYGFFYGLFFSLLLFLSEYFQINNIFVSIISLIFPIVLIFRSIDLFKKFNDKKISLSQSIKIGLGIGIFGGLVYTIYTLLHYNFSNLKIATINLIVMLSKAFIISIILGLLKRN